MAFTATPGYTWSNGEVITAVKLNSAATPTIPDGGVYGFGNGSSASPSVYFSSSTSTGFYRSATDTIGVAFAGSAGATLSATAWGLINAGANMQWSVGQDSSHGLYFQWTYNSTPSNASAVITTFGQSNPLKYQAISHSWDVAAQANCIQVFSNGSVLFSPAGSTDGLNQLQVQGGFGYDRQVGYLTTLSYASTTTLDFTSGNTFQTIPVSGALTLATTHLGVGRQLILRLVNSSGSTQNLSFPAGWVFIGNGAPTTILNGKTGVLSLLSFSTTDSSVVAAYAVQS